MRAVARCVLLLGLLGLAVGRTQEEKDAEQKAIKMKTTCAAQFPTCKPMRAANVAPVATHVSARYVNHMHHVLSQCPANDGYRRQLKEIFDELGISHKGLSKEDLKKKAYKEGVMPKYWKACVAARSLSYTA